MTFRKEHRENRQAGDGRQRLKCFFKSARVSLGLMVASWEMSRVNELFRGVSRVFFPKWQVLNSFKVPRQETRQQITDTDLERSLTRQTNGQPEKFSGRGCSAHEFNKASR